MVGVATEDADFTEKWNHRCRVGMDENSWALSSGGKNTLSVQDMFSNFSIFVSLFSLY